MNLKQSVVLNKLRSGRLVSCVKINCSDSRIVQIAALSGFDCIWSDMEHTANNLIGIENQILAAKAHNKDSLIRIPRGSYSDYIYPLELDASGIMVPHIMNQDDAKKVVWMTRFHPVGRRPLDGGNADGNFSMTDTLEYINHANRNRFVMIQIEDPEPMDDLDAICNLEGIDVIFFGPGDYTQGIGDPGNFSNPRINEARRLVATAAIKHGKYAGTVGTPDNIRELYQMGYRFISMGADVLGLADYFKRMMDVFREIM